MRDYRVRTALKCHDHKTGRKCDNPACNGNLYDSIINFGEDLNDNVWNKAQQNSDKADLMLSLGSSLRVTPAADLPEECALNGGNLVIVNL